MKVVKQRHIPGIGAMVDSLFSCLPFLSFINFIFISIVVYADIHPYLKVYVPWIQMWMFMLFLTVVTIIMMTAVYKWVLPSLWAFRGKQMFSFESDVLNELRNIKKKLGGKLPVGPDKTVAVSGGFDPIHKGHVRYIVEAIALGNWLQVILTRDDQLIAKKGKVFMSYDERKEIVEAVIGDRGEVLPNIDSTIVSTASIRKYKPDIFAKGGDTWDADNLPEAEVCKELGIEIVFGVGGFDKAQSSSLLTKEGI